MKSILFNLAIVGLFVWTLQQGCVRDKPLPPDDDDPPTEQPVTVPVNLTQIAMLPEDLYESSGIAMTSPGRIWSHNDSGNENRIYSIDLSGNLLKTITVSNATNVDWEELALDDMKRLYICDVGNNNNDRQNLVIYRIPDPETITGNTVTAEAIRFTYEDQTGFPPPASLRHYDMEAVVWHNDSLFMFTKDRSSPLSGYTRMYKVPALPGNHVAKYAGSFYLGDNVALVRVTAADIDHINGRLVLLTSLRLVVFSEYTGSRFFEGKVAYYPFTTIPGQVEAVIFAGGNDLYITSEGAGSTPGWLFKTTLPSGR